jgi:hypothetical protein
LTKRLGLGAAIYFHILAEGDASRLEGHFGKVEVGGVYELQGRALVESLGGVEGFDFRGEIDVAGDVDHARVFVAVEGAAKVAEAVLQVQTRLLADFPQDRRLVAFEGVDEAAGDA